MSTVLPINYSHEEIESFVYARGVSVDFPTFLQYRDRRDDEQADAEDLQSRLDESEGEASSLRAEIDGLKGQVWNAYIELGRIAGEDDGALLALADTLHEISQ